MPGRTGLQSEFYQLILSALYHADGMWGEATFDLYLKELPEHYGYLVAAGIGPANDAVLSTGFTDEDIAWLRRQPIFRTVADHFFESLRHWRFTGTIHAVPEGTVVLPGEPILRLVAPLPQAGLFEARLVQLVSYASGVATRSARMVQAARGRPVIDFGSRRSAGVEAAWHAARAAWIGGCAATTNTLAAASLGIPVWGVVSDTLLAAYEDHASAYDALLTHFPAGCHVDVPDADLRQGVRQFGPHKHAVRTVRLDHPHLATASRLLRASLDENGMNRTRILGSGSLDEYAIAQVVQAGAPIDLFGVGRALTVGSPATSPAISYRMAELYRGPEPVPVNGHWSAPWPGRKQVVRFPDHDRLCLEVEAPAYQAQGGEALLVPWVEGGERVREPEPLEKARARTQDQIGRVPERAQRLRRPEAMPVRVSDPLSELALR